MSTDATLNQSEPRTEPNSTEPQTCLACQNHALVLHPRQLTSLQVSRGAALSQFQRRETQMPNIFFRRAPKSFIHGWECEYRQQ